MRRPGKQKENEWGLSYPVPASLLSCNAGGARCYTLYPCPCICSCTCPALSLPLRCPCYVLPARAQPCHALPCIALFCCLTLSLPYPALPCSAPVFSNLDLPLPCPVFPYLVMSLYYTPALNPVLLYPVVLPMPLSFFVLPVLSLP